MTSNLHNTKLKLVILAFCICVLGVTTGCGGSAATTAKAEPPDNRLPIGKSEVLYGVGVEPSEAQKVGDILVRLKYFGDRPATVQVRYQDRRYAIRCVVRAGAENTSSAREWRSVGATFSTEVFRSSPVDIHLCDEHLKTLRTIPFEPLKPDLPIRVTFRPSAGGGSLVAQYSNNSDTSRSTPMILVADLRSFAC